MSATMEIKKDFAAKQIMVTSQFHTSVEKLWDAFPNRETLEKCGAPKPYQAFTKRVHFVDGGQSLYYMLSPQGEKHWCMAEFKNIHLGWLQVHTILSLLLFKRKSW